MLWSGAGLGAEQALQQLLEPEGGVFVSYLWRGVDIFQQCEWGGNANKQPISDGGMLLGGATLNSQRLWRAAVDTVTVHAAYDIRVKFRDGRM